MEKGSLLLSRDSDFSSFLSNKLKKFKFLFGEGGVSMKKNIIVLCNRVINKYLKGVNGVSFGLEKL